MADDLKGADEDPPIIPAKKKPPRVYKGDELIAQKLKPGDIVQAIDRTIIGTKAKLPQFMVVVGQLPGWRVGEIQLTYRDPRAGFATRSVSIRQDLRMNLLTGTQGQKLSKELAGYIDSKPPDRVIVTLGADPEIFVTDLKGRVIPAWTFLESKKTPNSFVNNTLYWDGFQAEYTIPAATCLSYMCDDIQRGMLGILNLAKAKFGADVILSNQSVVEVDTDTLASGADEHVQFGCMPSKNVYGLMGRAEDGRNVPMRFAGGHLHFGHRDFTPESEIRCIKALDSILGVACVSMFANYDNPVRRQFYGLAGEYRRPAHGIEYRALSNAWLMHPVVTNVVVEIGRRALAYGWFKHSSWKATEDETVSVIQGCDVDGARAILKRNEPYLDSLMSPFVTKLISQGIEAYIKNPADIIGNWNVSPSGYWVNHCDGIGKGINNSRHLIESGQKL